MLRNRIRCFRFASSFAAGESTTYLRPMTTTQLVSLFPAPRNKYLRSQRIHALQLLTPGLPSGPHRLLHHKTLSPPSLITLRTHLSTYLSMVSPAFANAYFLTSSVSASDRTAARPWDQAYHSQVEGLVWVIRDEGDGEGFHLGGCWKGVGGLWTIWLGA